MMHQERSHEIGIMVSDPSELRSLREWLARIPAVQVEQLPPSPRPGELGAVDILTVLASSGGVLAVAVRSLPEFIRSRRSDLTITVTVEGKEFTLTASNLDDVAPVIGKMLDG